MSDQPQPHQRGELESQAPYPSAVRGLRSQVLALAGRFASQRTTPTTAGTLPTHQPLFVGLVVAVTVVVVGLTFIPVLSLGPIVESLT